MTSFILTLKSNLDVLEENFNNEGGLNLNIIKNNTNFVIAILSENKIEADNFFCEYAGYSVALIGNIVNRLELITIAQILDPHAITYNDSYIVCTLFKHFGEKAISLIDGCFTVLYMKHHSVKLYTNSKPTYPLYYYNEEEQFWISNEVKFLSKLKIIDSSLIPLNNFDPKANQSKYFTIFQRIKRIPLLCSLECVIESRKSIKIKHYTYGDYPQEQVQVYDINKVLSILDYEFYTTTKSILDNLCNNNNVGVALSGGVDSSIVAAYAKKCNPNAQIHCFTVGTHQTNEFYYAKLCCEFMGATHHEVIINEKMFVEGIMNLVYYNEMFDAFAIEAYASLNAIHTECKKYSNILLTGINADSIFSGIHKLGLDKQEINSHQSFFDLSRYYWNGLLSPYRGKVNSIIEYSPYTTAKLISLINPLAAATKMQYKTDKYLLKILAENRQLLPVRNILRGKVRYEQGAAVDVMFAEFLQIRPEMYNKRHLYIYKLFQLLFEYKIHFKDIDPYRLRDKLGNEQ